MLDHRRESPRGAPVVANTRSVSHPCKKGCVRRRQRSLGPRLHEVTDSSFSTGSAKRGIKRGHKDSSLSRDTDLNLVTRPGLLSKTQGLSLAQAERRHGAQGRPCLPGSHAAPPPARHAANLTGELCQPSNFEQNRPISVAVVACQRLVGYLTLRGRGVVWTESRHRLSTEANHLTSSTTAEEV